MVQAVRVNKDTTLKGPDQSTTRRRVREVEGFGPFSFVHPEAAQPVTTDSVLLAGFAAPLSETDRVIDIGSGSGAIPMMIASEFSAADRSMKGMPRVTAVEIDAEAAACLAENVRENGLDGRIIPVQADFRELSKGYPPGSFDVVITNPPYTKAGEGRVSPVPGRAAARTEVFGTIADLLETSAYLLADSGRLFIVFPMRREKELKGELAARGFSIRRLCYVHARQGDDSRVFMAEAVRAKGEEVSEPLVEHIYTGRSG